MDFENYDFPPPSFGNFVKKKSSVFSPFLFYHLNIVINNLK